MEIGLFFSALGFGSTCAFIATRFKSVPVNQYMAKTGPFVSGVKVSRNTVKLPFQQIKIINLNPINYHFTGNNMSKELVPFELPLTFTISPKHPEEDMEGFVLYATRLGDMDHDAVQNIISGIVHGETRVYVAGLTIENIFNDKEVFREMVVKKIQEDLNQFGLKIHNANIEEMNDTVGNKYFANLKMKALEEASTRSKIDIANAKKVCDIGVAEAEKEGEIGAKIREVTTRKEKSVLETDAKQTETQQDQKISDYSRELAVTNTLNKQFEEIAKIDAHKITEIKRIDVESDLNKRKQQQELEHLRTQEVIHATAIAEANITKIENDAAAIRINAKANADSITIKAEAESIAIKLNAEALLVAKIKEAEGIRATLEATAEGMEKLYDVSQTNPQMTNFVLALQHGLFDANGLFTVMAEKQADAVRGLQPKINIWSTGTGTDKDDYASVISGLVKTLPPVLDVIQQQTNIKLPDFISKE